jgi:hypothetical protein
VNSVSDQGNFKETIGAFFVPESVRRRDTALGLSRIEVSSINDGLISLGEAREFRSKSVDRLSKECADVERNGGI